MKIRVGADFFLSLFIMLLSNGLDYSLIFLFSALIHEVGHLVLLSHYKARKIEMRLGLLGAEIKADTSRISYMGEVSVYLAGILFNILASFLCLVLLRIKFDERLIFFFFSNLLYALVNLAPVESLDGGQALKAFLLLIFQDMYTSEKVFYLVSLVSSVALFSLSVVLLFKVGSNVTLAMISLWGIYQCIPSKPRCRSAS